MRKFKVAVYTIALNEEKHVKRWYESAKDADLLVIADTGSTDKTKFLAKSLGIAVTAIDVTPWRFDVARNASLALIPDDYDICIQLDMDEVLSLGWRDKIEEAYEQGNHWPIYKHVTRRDEKGNPRNFQHYFKIHPRKGFHWKYPIHEVLVHEPNLTFERKVIDLEVDHIKDESKSRKSYLDLLEKAVQEEPGDWRMNHYLNREYFYNHDWLKVLQTAYRCEEIPGGWDVERASNYMWASEAAHHLNMPPLAVEWARKATDAAPHFYEVWHWRAHIAHLHGKWEECLEFSKKRLTLERQSHHLVKPEVWEWWGYDLIALSSHRLGLNNDAVNYGHKALTRSPQNERLKSNQKFYIQAYERENESERGDLASVTWAILAKDAADALPLYLNSLLRQSYPKSLIDLYIRTNDNKDSTHDLLAQFVKDYGSFFKSVKFDGTDIQENLKNYELHEWNSERFAILGDIRQKSLEYAKERGNSFYFCSDVDNFLMDKTLEYLVNQDKPVIAPLLRCVIPAKWPPISLENSHYANFHDAVDDNYWFVSTDKYRKILSGELQGIFEVPLVHCTYLVRADVFEFIDYKLKPGDWEYKNFAASCKKFGISQFIDARKTYGYLTLSNDVESCESAMLKLEENSITKIPGSVVEVHGENISAASKVFDEIYQKSIWGFQSGPGSNPEAAKPWIDFVNNFLESNSINSILDIGCGDWRLGEHYNLEGKSYTGIDVSAEALKIARSRSKKNTMFLQNDAVIMDWQPVDLVLIKDVLQHLPNSSIRDVMANIFLNAKYAIICNDYWPDNRDIELGGYRGLNLKESPFNLSLMDIRYYGSEKKLISLFSKVALGSNTRSLVPSEF